MIKTISSTVIIAFSFTLGHNALRVSRGRNITRMDERIVIFFVLRRDGSHVSLVERTPGCTWQEMAIVTRSAVFWLVKDGGENWQPAEF